MFFCVVLANVRNPAPILAIYMNKLASRFKLRASRKAEMAQVHSRLAARSSQLVAGERGFTLVELMVVTGIFVVITSLILANNTRFGGAVLLENLAYDIALSVRRAQGYGIAVQRFGTDDFSAGYGVNFTSGTPTVYILFADIYPKSTGNGIYEPDKSELVESVSIQGGYRIIDLCATSPNSRSETCGLTALDILFKRPEPGAFISKNGISGIANPAALQEKGRIILESPRGNKTSVIVEASGQIAVEKI